MKSEAATGVTAPRQAAGTESVRSEPVLVGGTRTAYLLLSAAYLVVLAAALRHGFSLAVDAFTVVLVLGVAHALAGQLLGWASLPAMARPVPREPRAGLRVAVATTFMSGHESLDMLERSVRALVALEYPHDTWVLDENDDPAVKQLCERLGAAHFTRRGRSEYQQASGPLEARTKHGNYNAWLTEAGFDAYDIVVGFDPDHVARPDYLTALLGYFEDPAVGYVQAPQVYYNQQASFIARGAAEETYTYYSVTQMASFAWGYPIVVGAHHCHRMAALREVGGFPAHDAEDLLITLLYRSRGWRGVYVPRVLARGLAPVDWPAYLKQQLRWARSVTDIKLRALPRLAAGLPPRERVLSVLHGVNYLRPLWSGVALLVLVILLVTGAAPPALSWSTAAHLLLLVAAGLGLDRFRQRFYLEPARERGLRWRAALLGQAKWFYFLLGVVEVVAGRKRGYILTPKLDQPAARSRLLLPHLITAGVITAAWSINLALGHGSHPLLHLWAGFTALVYFGLAWTGTWRFPPAYDPRAVAVAAAPAGAA